MIGDKSSLRDNNYFRNSASVYRSERVIHSRDQIQNTSELEVGKLYDEVFYLSKSKPCAVVRTLRIESVGRDKYGTVIAVQLPRDKFEKERKVEVPAYDLGLAPHPKRKKLWNIVKYLIPHR